MVQRSTLFATICLAVFGSLPAEIANASLVVNDDETVASVYELAQASSPEPTANPNAPASAEEILLAPGMKGNEVMLLQLQLQRLGFYSDAVDGLYGPATQEAVADFQREIGLPATGALDQLTWQRIQAPQFVPSTESPATEEPPTSPPASDTTADSAPPTETSPAAAEDPASTTATEESETTETPETPEAAPAADNGSPFIWLMLGLLILLVVVSGGILLSLFLRRPQQSSPSVSKPKADAAVNQLPGPVAFDNGGDNGVGDSGLKGQNGAAAKPDALLADASPRMSRVNIVDELVEELTSPDSSKRRRAIWELGQRGDSTAIQPLVNLMPDADSKERSLILAALTEVSTRSLKPMNRALAMALQDPNAEVRQNAIRDLTRIYDLMGQASQMLSHVVADDSDTEVKETARWALEQLGRIRQLAGADSPLTLSGMAQQTAQLESVENESEHPTPS